MNFNNSFSVALRVLSSVFVVAPSFVFAEPPDTDSDPGQSVEQQKETESPMDWSKPVVSRGFGRSEHLPADAIPFREDYKAGEVAYFFGDYKNAFAKWRPLAEAGVPDAQANIGWLYQTGRGAEQSLERAKFWYEKAVAQNHPVALNNLATFYENGVVVEKNQERAYGLYLRAAEQGYRFAQYNVGVMLLEGRGAKQDSASARRWLQQAAAQGVDAAQDTLDKLSATGTD